MAQSEVARGKDGSARAAEFLGEFDAYLGTAKGLAEGNRRKYGRLVLDSVTQPTSRNTVSHTYRSMRPTTGSSRKSLILSTSAPIRRLANALSQ